MMGSTARLSPDREPGNREAARTNPTWVIRRASRRLRQGSSTPETARTNPTRAVPKLSSRSGDGSSTPKVRERTQCAGTATRQSEQPVEPAESNGSPHPADPADAPEDRRVNRPQICANEPNPVGPADAGMVGRSFLGPESARTNPMRPDPNESGGRTNDTTSRIPQLRSVNTFSRLNHHTGSPPGRSPPQKARERTQCERSGGCREGLESAPGPGKRANEPNSPHCERHRGHTIDTVGRISRIRPADASGRLNRGLRKTTRSVVRRAGGTAQPSGVIGSGWPRRTRRSSRFTGLTRWALKPASRERRRSSSLP